jgi:phospholipid transport system substrate-binding protein
MTRSLRPLLSVAVAVLAVGLLGAAPARAQDVAPDALVRSVTNDVLETIRGDKEIQQGNARRITEVIEAKVLPHFNFTRMTALAMGASWRRATPDQQKQLVDQFRTLLVRTYSNGLASYRDQVIDYKPLKMQSADTEVTVRSEVKQSGAQPVQLDYSMEKSTGSWKVYDVAIGGVSLVTTYRETFTQEVRANGVDGLIKSLADKNSQLAQAKR